MHRSAALVLAGFFILFPLTSEALASGCPNLVNYQGRVTDTAGTPGSDGAHSFEFRIFSSPTGGTPLWTDSTNLVTSSGLFNHILGSVNALPPTLFPDNDELYLEVEVDGET